jgi:POT family proton-dependent oligopeptide transporter
MSVTPAAARDFLGHPRGLAILFATEAWERFSYFGNAALVVLYMTKYLLEPGRFEAVLGLEAVKAALELPFGRLEGQPLASQLFGFYTGLAYFTPVLGGLVADRLLGRHRTVIIGGLLMALGHFMMAFETLFLVALSLLIVGIGAFKPNISSEVGALYAPGDDRRDRAYSIFYLGINVGAFLAPLICGTLAVHYGWHYGFGAAGVGMLVSLGIYLAGARTLPREAPPSAVAGARAKRRLDASERRAVLALIATCALVTPFWAAYDQQSNTLLLWAEDFTDRSVDLGFWRGEIPSPWFLALNPLMIFLLTPLIVRRWAEQGRRGSELFPISKMAFGCLCVALANLVMAAAAGVAADILAGFLGGFWSRMGKTNFFLMIALIAALASVALAAASRIVQRSVISNR